MRSSSRLAGASRHFRLVLALASALVPVACASVLGDFSTGTPVQGGEGGVANGDGGGIGSDGGTPPVDGGGGGSDVVAPPVDGNVPFEAGVEAGPPLSVLSCTNWQNSNPMVVLTFPAPDSGSGNNGTPIGPIYVEHIGGSQSLVRIIAGTNAPNGSNTEVFTVSDQGGNNSTARSTFQQTGLRSELRAAGEVDLFLQSFMTNEYEIISIADSNSGSGLETQAPLATIGPPPDQQGGGGDFRANLFKLPSSAYYALAAYSSQTANEYDLSGWEVAAGSWAQLVSAQSEFGIDTPMVANGTDLYGFLAPPGQGGGGGPAILSEYTFSTANSTVSAPRTVTPDGGSAATIAASVAASGSYALGFVEISGLQGADVRVGLVPPASINTFLIDDLPLLTFKPAGDAGFFDTTPFNNQNGPGARWLSNGDFAVMGGGGTGSTGSYSGINFYVATPGGQWIIETAGSGSNLFAGQTNIPTTAFDLSSAVNDLVFSFDVAWVAQMTDGSTNLYFNVLNCSL